MKPSDLPTNDDLLAEELKDDEFRAEWERTALGRAVAVWLVSYRADNDLTQKQLAERLGMRQPQVARLESGEDNPRWETIQRIASRLQREFTAHISPAGRPSQHLTKRGRDSAVAQFDGEDMSLLVAAS